MSNFERFSSMVSINHMKDQLIEIDGLEYTATIKHSIFFLGINGRFNGLVVYIGGEDIQILPCEDRAGFRVKRITRIIGCNPYRILFEGIVNMDLPDDSLRTLEIFLKHCVAAAYPQLTINWKGPVMATFEDDQVSLTYGEENGDIGWAYAQLAEKKLVARRGWNGKGLFLFLVDGSEFEVNRAPLLGIFPAGTKIKYNSHVDIRNPDGSISTWAPSGSDGQAKDWVSVSLTVK